MGAIEFRLPDVGEGIAAGDIIEWRVTVGDHVREGQELVEVQTDKAIVVIPCPTAGVVTRLCASAGESLPVGAVLAVFQTDEAVPDADPTRDHAVPAQRDDATTASSPAGGRSLAAPATRRLARELGVDLAGVSGTGPNGRILREDVARGPAVLVPSPAPGSPASAAGVATGSGLGPAAGQVVPLRGVRRAIAQTLTRAWQEIPHVIDYREVDATRLVEARQLLKQRALDGNDEALARALSPTALIARAAALALADHPYVNASIDLQREEITLHKQINLGIATATAEGLTVPVLHGAAGKSIAALALEISELTRAARERRLRPDQLAGGTFTVNNYGGLGIWLGTPIIRPPEVANLGVGAVRDRVVAVNGQPVVRPILVLAVSGDHRVLDGHTLAAFVTQVVGLLEQPLLLFEDAR